jgi:hypothetical protein
LSVEVIDVAFVAIDGTPYVYFEDGRRSAAKLLTKDEARRIEVIATAQPIRIAASAQTNSAGINP